MPWGKVDDNLYDHPKLDRLGRDRLPAVGLHFLAISWCNRWLTDGAVPRERVVKLGGTLRLSELLVAVGLWELAGADYRIHDFLEFNQSREQVIRGREQRSEAGRIGGKARWRKDDGEPGASSGDPSGGPAKRPPRISSGDPSGAPSGDPLKLARARPVPSRPVETDIEVIYNPKTGEATDSLGQPLDRRVTG